MSNNDTVVKPFQLGGGGRIYRDARKLEEQRALAEADTKTEVETEASEDPELTDDTDDLDEVPSWLDASAPEQPPQEVELRDDQFDPPRPPRVGQVTAPALPEPDTEPEPATDWRERWSTCIELAGIACVSVGCFTLAIWLGLIITGICLIVLGVATSGKFRMTRDFLS